MSKKTKGVQSNGAIREAIGTKIDTTLVPYELIVAAAIGLNYGEAKYEARNFEKGLSERNVLNSVDRHLRAIMAGEIMDEASGLPHYALLSSSVAMYVCLEMRQTIVRDLPDPALTPFDVATISELAQGILDKQIIPKKKPK